MGPHVFETEALLLVLPTTEYQKRVPVTIVTSLTDMAVESLGPLDQSILSTSWKTMCCTTQSRRKVQAQQLHKSTVKSTKQITLPPSSTTVLKEHTKPKGYGMRINLITEPSEINQLPPNVQCTPTYCNLDQGSNRVTVGLRNVSAKQITVPSRALVCQVQLASMVAKIQTPKGQDPTEQRREDNTRILDQLDLGELESWSEEQQQAAEILENVIY